MAVGWAKSAVHATPFLIFRRTADDSEEWNQSAAYSYKPIPRICSNLQAFFGYGAFHNTDQHDPNCDNECYFNFHGSTFDVYSTNGGWKQLYSLTFGIKGVPCRPVDMKYLTQSLRGRYFAWTGDRGTISIWDFETGQYITSISIPNDTRVVCAALCEDGSMITITVNGCIQLYDVVTGVKLGVHQAEWKACNGSEIIFRQEYFMALDPAKSTSGSKNIDARSKRIVGGFLMPLEDLIYMTLDPVNLSDNSWTDRNQSSAETTFVLGRAHAPARPFTIMRLGIANVYKSAALSLGPASESRSCSGFYMASTSQLVLILNGFLQVWRLPSEANQQYELVHVEAFFAASKAHANDICITKASS
ncbi:hypothetical protein BGZ75_001265, partial [Mortierella antarctica]